MKKKFTLALLIMLVLGMVNVLGASAASVKDLMANSFKPVGKCLYVYGGGWNEADTAAGYEALNYGISPTWEAFYNSNGAEYNHKDARYQIHNGLDCTGYIGWNMYQLFGKSYNEEGYVFQAKNMTQKYTGIFGGSFTPAEMVKDYECGDIMSTNGHAYIVVGQCDDKSVVLMHASPPAVSLCGTSTPSGEEYSQAVMLAKSYMSTYYPKMYEKYDTCHRGVSYLTAYNQMRWNEKVLSDSDGYRKMRVEDILWDLFVNVKIYLNGERIHFEKEPFIENSVTYVSAKEMGLVSDDREMVPVREIAEAMNLSVTWDGDSKSVCLSDK